MKKAKIKCRNCGWTGEVYIPESRRDSWGDKPIPRGYQHGNRCECGQPFNWDDPGGTQSGFSIIA